MNLTVSPGGPLHGQVVLPGDKSISHRAALFAALADGESRINNFLVSGVTDAMLRALTALGVPWHLEGDTLVVVGGGTSALKPPQAPIDCGNSATTIRLLAGALAAAGIPAVLDGSAGLRRRPMGRIIEPLQAMGVAIQAGPGGGAPLTLAGRPAGERLKPLAYTLPVASAQLKSCLLLAGLAAGGPVELCEPVPSRDHTERMLRTLGVHIEDAAPGSPTPTLRLIPPDPLRLTPLNMTIPGDFSAAAFLLVAALITPGSSVLLKGVGLNPTRTGLLDALQEMGANILVSSPSLVSGEPVGDLTVRAGELRGGSVSGERVVRMIDEFPAFAVAAAFARGPSEVCQAEELRYKESDRIGALCAGLRALGVNAEEKPDGFIVDGRGSLPGGAQLDPHGDHRLAMSLALAGLAAERPVTVEYAGIIGESFPEFSEVLRSLGADILLE